MAFESNLEDLHFLLLERLDFERLLSTPRFSGVGMDMVEMVLNEADKVSRGVIAPLNKVGDQVGAHYIDSSVVLPEGFKNAWKTISEAGWLGLTGDPDYQGQGLPFSLMVAVHSLFMSACTSFSLGCGLASSAAGVIAHFADDEAKGLFLENLYSGRWSATMCLTEPEAGSALGSVRTQATKIDGTQNRYLITGNKIFISGGDHDLTENIIHLVLARVPGAPEGTGGLSLFIVPKIKIDADGLMGAHNDVVCTRIEHKMGIKASPTCSLSFGESGHCEGILIGEENRGLRAMFRMMNDERIVVGVQGAALASSAYLYALAYCKERVQGSSWSRVREKGAPGVPIIEHPDLRRMLMWQKSHVEGMTALLLTTAYYSDLSFALEDKAERSHYADFVELLTPVCKAFCTDRGFQSTVLALQCLGGYGYISEYDVEQYVRDAKIGSIYEGTNGIQALDFLGRKAPMRNGGVLSSYLSLMTEDMTRLEKHEKLAHYARKLKSVMGRFAAGLLEIQGFVGEQTPLALLQADSVTNMMGDLCVAHQLLTQSELAYTKMKEAFEKAGAGDNEAKNRMIREDPRVKFLYGKTRSARFFITQVLPGVDAGLEALKARDASAMDPVW